jgi:hypothetical protein
MRDDGDRLCEFHRLSAPYLRGRLSATFCPLCCVWSCPSLDALFAQRQMQVVAATSSAELIFDAGSSSSPVAAAVVRLRTLYNTSARISDRCLGLCFCASGVYVWCVIFVNKTPLAVENLACIYCRHRNVLIAAVVLVD